jgi:cobalt/nickel transport system permease protein
VRMHDPYIERPSVIHRLPAVVKLIIAILLIITAVIFPRGYWLGYIVLGAIILLSALLSRLPYLKIIKRLILLEPFVIVISILSLFQPDGDTVFLSLVTKGSLSLYVMILLIATTRFSEIINVLWKARVPALLVTTLSLMYRYLFLIVSEADRMSRARAGRTFTRGRFFLWRNFAEIVGNLFVRTATRAERIYAAMCARGWKS